MWFIEFLRALVRPLISLAFVAVILALTYSLVTRFANEDMANTLLVFVIATGSTVVGFYFASRQSKEK